MFAAYKSANLTESNDQIKEVDGGFLQNQSFESSLVPSTSQLQEISSSSLSESESESEDEKKAVAIYRKPPSPKTQLFYVDSEPRREYLKMDSLPVRCLPRYRLSHKFSLFARKYNNNSTKFRRYFRVKKSKKGDVGDKMDVSVAGEELRIFLSKNPNNVEKWFQYIQYQVRFLSQLITFN